MCASANPCGEIRLVDVVFPDRANHYGTLFGGNALQLMGKAAFIAATRRARQHVVMASADNMISTNRCASARWSNSSPASRASAAPR